MKQFVWIFVCILPFITFAQTEAKQPYGDSLKIIDIHTQGAWAVWSKIDSAWMHGEYGQILQKFKLHMNCAHCEDVLMEVEMTINQEGKVTAHRIIRSDKCGEDFDKALENAFMKWFYELEFPDFFRNSRFTSQLGTGLKC
jgi:hypothetical protein